MGETSYLKPMNFWKGIVVLVMVLSACKSDHHSKDWGSGEPLFVSLDSKSSGVDFINTLTESTESNYYQYMYTYIGGGVVAEDLDGDQLPDLAFISNSDGVHLYKNEGGLKFTDKTTPALPPAEGFYCGITVVDINADGLSDLYVTRGGWIDEDGLFENQLFINQGDFVFKEEAEAYGLNDPNRGIQAVFFDYDRDSDLDVYISNTPVISGRAEVLDLQSIESNPQTMSQLGSDRLYQNNGKGQFTDVSTAAGLVYDLGFGLNPQAIDLNNDGWLDIYVCNDFNSPDLVYLNNTDGSFTESRDSFFRHMSFNSMGSDVADFNNDGVEDLITLDMNPSDYVRSKTTMGMTSIPVFEEMVARGYHHQYMHNMLHLGNEGRALREISQLAGIGNTDWSWAVLATDFDLDGLDDLFVTNGVYRDVLDRDRNNEIVDILRENQRKPTKEDFLRFAQMLPQQKLDNFFFKNDGDLTFTDVSQSWLEGQPTFSNGATYSDLDADGDLDLIVNNINQTALILKNQAIDFSLGDALRINVKGPGDNTLAVGTLLQVHFADGSIITRRVLTTRGFLSGTGHAVHFGLPPDREVRYLKIQWPDGMKSQIAGSELEDHMEIDYNQSDFISDEPSELQALFQEQAVDLHHLDPYFNDFDFQVLLPHKLSQTGPGGAVGDINGDGLDDIYIGGGRDQLGQILLGKHGGDFELSKRQNFQGHAFYEDQDAAFLHLNDDEHLDLYVVSGSYEFLSEWQLLQDRIYLGDGKGGFQYSQESLPEMYSSGSVVRASDFDGDGDQDLFVGGRVLPAEYPYAPESYLLENVEGKMVNVTPERAPELTEIGMVTDADWTDINADGHPDLIVVGEWMGVEVLLNKGEGLERSSSFPNLQNAKGWWNCIKAADIDHDGDIDLIAGNLGLNYKYKASMSEPFHVYTSDFDYNGVEDVLLAKIYDDREVPIRGKTCMTQQLPALARTVPSYQDFAAQDLAGLVGDLTDALHLVATEFRSGIFLQGENGSFSFEPFENALQMAPINDIVYWDFDQDGTEDLLMAGNNYMSEVETTRADAGDGYFLKGLPNGGFKYISNHLSGFRADRDVRKILLAGGARNKSIFVLNNNDGHQVYSVNETE